MKTVFIIVLICVAAVIFFWFRSEPVVIRQPHLSFPDDENGDVLRKMHAAGDNLDAARDINFSFVFKTQSEAERFAAAVTAPDFRAEASAFPERKMWQAEVTFFMLPTYAAISELETRLSKVAAEYGGSPDGWGSFLQP
jgi:Regulator of ribonuclease activity B